MSFFTRVSTRASTRARPTPRFWNLGCTTTSQMVAVLAPSLVARPNPTTLPLRLSTSASSAKVWSSAHRRRAGSRRAKPTLEKRALSSAMSRT